MGGSSLAPDVCTAPSGRRRATSLCVSSTRPIQPSTPFATVDDLDPLATLTIIASKSGTTTEPNAFLADGVGARADRAQGPRSRVFGDQPGEFLAIITDPGRSLDAIPHHDELREVFLNPPDIGGRYSALTYVGLVPASLIGLDLDALFASALAMLGRAANPIRPSTPACRSASPSGRWPWAAATS